MIDFIEIKYWRLIDYLEKMYERGIYILRSVNFEGGGRGWVSKEMSISFSNL